MHNTSTVAKHMNTHATAMLTRTRQHCRNAQTHVKNLTHTHTDTQWLTCKKMRTDALSHKCTNRHTSYTHMHLNGLHYIVVSFPLALHVLLSTVISLQYAQQPANLWRAALITAQESSPPPLFRKKTLSGPQMRRRARTSLQQPADVYYMLYTAGERGVLVFSRITHMVVSLPVS